MMSLIDKLLERRARAAAQTASRRGMLKTLGRACWLVPVPFLCYPLPAAEGGAARPVEEGSDTDCDYWRYCAIDGFLCSCCGGSANTCPPGTEMSPGDLDRHLPQPGRWTQLRDFLQRLLR